MGKEIQYYAILDSRASRAEPAGIARRRYAEGDEFYDEALAANFSWQFTPLVVQWERAESSPDLVEVTEDEAKRIIERLRERWADSG
jgi:hypothetical protein